MIRPKIEIKMQKCSRCQAEVLDLTQHGCIEYLLTRLQAVEARCEEMESQLRGIDRDNHPTIYNQ